MCLIAAPIALGAAMLAGCGGGGGGKTATLTPKAETAAAKTPAAGTKMAPTKAATAASQPALGATESARATAAPAGSTTERTPASSGTGGRTYNETQAKTLLSEALLTPKDLSGTWTLSNDTTTDNAAAATADPAGAASFERCGRLLGRTAVMTPQDIVGAFLGGESVTTFSTATVYATEAGAADCAAEAAVRYQQPGELARTFGSTFVDPNAVTIALVDYPQTADGSFAATLTGQVNANGTVVDITILVIGFRKGNVTGAVGTAHSAGSIAPAELTPLLNAMLQRIAANQ
jgi:pyruvate/2-oxoglutarate dehydrogenase complex dihydrolipoamide acyltransferase (E2) component